jgi:hypothetical protein
MARSQKWIGSLILAGILAAPLAAQETKPAPTPAPAQTPATTPAPAPAPGQSAAQTPTPPPPANPADVATPDAILAALYDVISGTAGHPRDWNRFRSLFIDGARLIATSEDKDGKLHTRVVTPDGYVSMAGPFFEKVGFYERESARTTEAWANIQQVFSTYESRHAAADPAPFERGINSIQLLNDGKRWWVVTIFWQEESHDNPLPDKYLPPKP